jgi:hypothetical protein
MSAFTALDDILTEFPFDSFRVLAAFWRESAGDAGELPVIDDLDLVKAWKIASRLVVLDLHGPLEGAHRYRWRYAGTMLRDLAGFEMTGCFDDEVFPSDRLKDMRTVYDEMLRTGAPHAWHYHALTKDRDREFLWYWRLMLPVADADGRPRHLVGVYQPDDRNA